MNVSYAQNLEDFVLWQALGEKLDGFYIDVGGGHPVADNVSCWFYLQGWRGIVVEPRPELAHAYSFVRPRDKIFQGVAGNLTGETEFYAVDRLHGLSSLLKSVTSIADDLGVTYHVQRVLMTTLDDLIARENVGEIEFLKIDVEGAEKDVLAGLNLTYHRPKAMCIEAVAPGLMEENWNSWEPRLLDYNYRFMLFDGLNRYYAACEAEDVIARFPRVRPEWGAIPTFGLWERASSNRQHPDYELAVKLTRELIAALPRLDKSFLFDLSTREMTPEFLAAPATLETKRAALEILLPGSAAFAARANLVGLEADNIRNYCQIVIGSDYYRVTLARIAMSYDGGQVIEGTYI